MVRALDELNVRWAAEGRPTLGISVRQGKFDQDNDYSGLARLVEAARTALHTGTVVPVEDPLPRRRAVEVQQS